MNSSPMTLEVIACTVEDALEAEKGGADRLEVISHFDRGGFTPSLESVREIQQAVRIPLRIMLRESENHQTPSEAEVDRLCSKAVELASLLVDGIVLGFLRGERIDLELTRRILECAPTLKATFHHAFDEVSDQFQALADLSQCRQIDRVLTAGGPGDWATKSERLTRYQKVAEGRQIILVGGGVNAAVINALRTTTNLTEFHVGRAARVPASALGPVRSERVKVLRGR
jgi:copper homeostasis protein